MLNLMRKIRNDFGHSSDDRSFGISPIRERYRELDFNPNVWEAAIKRRVSVSRDNPRDRFIVAEAFLLMAIAHRTENLTKRSEATAVTDEELAAIVEAELAKSKSAPSTQAEKAE